jgi:hypothetical protein
MVFFLSISFVIVLFANDKIQNIISTTELNSTSAYDSINDSFSYINDYVVQRGFTLFFAILCIGILISSFLVRTHPIFIFLYILTLGVAIFVSIYLANAYALVVENAQLAELASNYAMMTFVMSNIGKILLGVAGISFVILFGKLGGGGNPSDDL